MIGDDLVIGGVLLTTGDDFLVFVGDSLVIGGFFLFAGFVIREVHVLSHFTAVS